MDSMDKKNEAFMQYRAYWKLSEEMIAYAAKDNLAEVARLLAMQVAYYARMSGAMPIPDLAQLISVATVDEDYAILLSDVTDPLVGVLGLVTGGALDDTKRQCNSAKTHRRNAPSSRVSTADTGFSAHPSRQARRCLRSCTLTHP